MTTLHPFGAIHTDRRGKVRAELAALVDETDADALFVEFPAGGYDLRTTVAAFARAPLFALGLAIVAVVQWPLYALLCRSPFPAEVVAARALGAERGLPVHAVDDHPIEAAGRTGAGGATVNWVGLLAALAVAPRVGLLAAGAIFAVWLGGSLLYRVHPAAWGVVALAGPVGLLGVALRLGVASLVVVLAAVVAMYVGTWRTFGHRNDEMVDRLVAVAAADGHDAVVLTTGKAHVPGIRGAVADRDDVTLGDGHVSRLLRAGRPMADVSGAGDPSESDASGTAATGTTVPNDRIAVLGRRVVAAAVDAVASLTVGAVTGIAFAVVAVAIGYPVGSPAVAGAVLAGGVVGWLGYHAAFDRRFGWTLGKRLLGLRVLDVDGGRPSRRAALVRALCRPVEVLPLGVPAAAAALWSDRRQRLGDRLAGTVVVDDEG